MKEHKKGLALSIMVILLPCVAGILLWNRLPEQIPIHFNANNEVDSYGSKLFVVFGLPALMAFFQFLCIVVLVNDPKKHNFNPRLFTLVMAIVPACSLLIGILSYGTALGYAINVLMAMYLLVGLMFVGIGIYMPKMKQNYTMGIKLPWTLHSEDNWNKTHLLGGRLWLIGGLLLILNAWLQSMALFLAVTILCSLIPAVYSFILYKRSGLQNEDNHH